MSHLPLKHSIHKVGGIGKNSRIWIANSNLLKSFDIGDLLDIQYDEENREIRVNRAELLANHTLSSRNGTTPILDIKNRSVTETFEGIEKVEVLYYENKIVIRATKNEKLRKERLNKNDNTLFELFCGGGTLTHQMTKKGLFKSIGGLEINDKFLMQFEENNKEAKITIHSAIEDVHPSDYPQASYCALGIPCTHFSGSNLALTQALKNLKGGVATDEDMERIEQRYNAEALVHHILVAIKSINPKALICEEVVEFSNTSASILLRTVLKQMGFHLSETIIEGRNTSRKRWAMVAHMEKKINLDNLHFEDDVTIEDLLETPLEEREWQTDTENKRVAGMKRKNLGVRSYFPTDDKIGTITCHGTRHTEPILQLDEGTELYSEFTNQEIANLHGLEGYKLSGIKTLDRNILGQGVTNGFELIAERLAG